MARQFSAGQAGASRQLGTVGIAHLHRFEPNPAVRESASELQVSALTYGNAVENLAVLKTILQPNFGGAGRRAHIDQNIAS